MRYGAKYGGKIYVASQPSNVIQHLVLEYGPLVIQGQVVPGGWHHMVSPVDEEIIELLKNDYEIVDLDDLAHDRARDRWLKDLED